MPDERPIDILVRGGTVVDGTGAPGRVADVAVRDGRIAGIGEIDARAARIIDASGRVVCPGFIDVHAHDDAAVIVTPMDFKLMQGVTTDIVGNCGAGVAPLAERSMSALPGAELILGALPDVSWLSFGEYMAAVEASQPAINVACLVPHGVVRNKHLGMGAGAPEPAELDAMREDVAEGMAAGAVGLSTGLIYAPGMHATTEEIIELARVAAQYVGGIYVSHIRGEGSELMDAVREAIRIGEEGGLPAQISHHKAGSPEVWGMTRDTLALIDARVAAGQDVTMDVYPYVAASTILAAFAGRKEQVDPSKVLIASVKDHAEYEGKTIAEIADTLDLPAEQAMSRVLRDEPFAVAVFFIMDEADVQRVLSHPLCMVGSDGIPTPTGKPHPRLYGTFARVLGTYVREGRLLTIEEAVRKMTSLPARRFQLAERGELREGWAADIVVFDPETVADVATYQEPRQYPPGIDCVIVNGEVAADGGRQTARHAGRLLRRGVA